MFMDEMTKLSLRISIDEKEMLSYYADLNDLSMSQVIRQAIREYLQRKQDEE